MFEHRTYITLREDSRESKQCAPDFVVAPLPLVIAEISLTSHLALDGVIAGNMLKKIINM